MKEVLKKTPVLRVICFFVILVALIIPVQNMLLYRNKETDNSSYQVINFYREKKDSLNPVFIGSSNCYAFYSPLFVYNSYGTKTGNFSSSGMGMIFYKYAIEEVLKTQENALIVLTVTPMDIMNYTALHCLVDYMPWSINKINFIKRYFTYGEESILNSVEYFFPLMRLHERWSTLKLDDFNLNTDIKGASDYEYYLTYMNDISEDMNYSEERSEIPDTWKDMMYDLLDYCDDNNIEIVFLFPPRSFNEAEYTQLNSLIDTIKSRNYYVMDLRDKASEIGLDFSCDYYNKGHTNIHGSIKYSDYVINQICNKYGIQLNDGKNSEWDSAFNNYYEIIKPYVLDVELDMKQRDYHLERPELISVVQKNDYVEVKWNTVENADGYLVYRKTDNEWIRVSDTKELSYSDTECVSGVNTYTVISYRNDNGVTKYGNYDYKGISVEVNK